MKISKSHFSYITGFFTPILLLVFVIDPFLFSYLAFEIEAEHTTIDEYYKSYNTYSDMKDDEGKKVIFVGSSQTKYGVDCNFIEQNSPSKISCYNVGTPGDVPYYRISEIPLLLEAEPDIVFLEVSPRSLTNLSNLHNFNQNLFVRYGLAGIHQNEKEISSWASIVRPSDRSYISDDFIEQYEYRNSYRQQILDSRVEVAFEKLLTGSEIRAKKTWTQEEILISKSKLGDFLSEPSWQSSNSSHSIDCLKYTIDILKSNGIEVRLYSLPFDTSVIKNLPSGHWDGFNTTVEYLVHSKELVHLNLVFEKWESEYFRDLTHLYDDGTIKLSNLFIDELNKN